MFAATGVAGPAAGVAGSEERVETQAGDQHSQQGQPAVH